jgi:hypothetical protein
VYKCTTAGSASVAKWAYVGSIRGASGATASVATTSSNGLMSSTDKSRLDNLNSRIQLGTGCNLVYDSTNKCVSFQFL